MRSYGMIAAMALLGACSAGEPQIEGYAFSTDDARDALLAAKFPKGVIPNFSRHNIDFKKATGGGFEWKVMTDDGVGFTCEAKIMPTDNEDTRSVVINSCSLPAFNGPVTRKLDELVAETLSTPAPAA